MEFKETRGIFLQIADQMCDMILNGKWQAQERIPAIREMGAISGVNPNTVTRSYKELLDREIIYNKRGIGYFVSNDAVSRITKMKRDEFVRDEVPRVFNTMEQLQLGWEDITHLYQEFRKSREAENGQKNKNQ